MPYYIQMDGVGSTQGGVLVLGATNVPWELDPAMRRRFEKRVYIALPDAAARAYMFKLNLGNTDNDISEDQFRLMGENSEGYSGSDIAVVVREALMEPLRKCQTAKQFRVIPSSTPGEEAEYHPCPEYPNCQYCPIPLHDPFLSKVGGGPSIDPGAIGPSTQCQHCGAQKMTLYDVPSAGLRVPVIIYSDFEKALKRAHSSVGTDELQQFIDWTAEFGQDG